MRSHGERRPGVENRLTRHAGHDLDRGADVHQDLMGREEAIEGDAIRGVDGGRTRGTRARRPPDGGRQSTRLTGTPLSDERRGEELGAGDDGVERIAQEIGLRRHRAPRRSRALSRRRSGYWYTRSRRACGGLFLPLETLGVQVGPDHVSHDRQVAPAAPRARLGERRADGADRVGVRAVAEDEIEQQHGDARIIARTDDRPVPLLGSMIGCGRPRV